jgi:protein dithiol oxidoreductase (disulfide-forming)
VISHLVSLTATQCAKIADVLSSVSVNIRALLLSKAITLFYFIAGDFIVLNSRRFALVLLTLFLLPLSFSATAEVFKEGEDYEKLDIPGSVVDPKKIEVREFFWYGCPHCFELEASLHDWVKTLPADVNFVRTPAVMNKSWELHGKAYFAAKAMGVEDTLHEVLFNAIHKDHRKLSEPAEIGDLVAEHGVDAKQFKAMMESFTVHTEIARADAAARAYRLSGVPTIIVNGKYVVDGLKAKGYPRLLQIVGYLIEVERKSPNK